MTLEQKLVSLTQEIALDIKSLFSKIGSLSGLTTTTKTDIVSAINEVQANTIENVQVNNVVQTVTAKTVNITVPTTLSSLNDDSTHRLVTDTQLNNFQSSYNNSVYVSGGATTSLTFSSSKYYGSISSPLIGNISYNFTNANSGSKAIVFHSDGSEPIYGIGTYKQFGNYIPSNLNILTFTFIDSNTVLLEIAYSNNVGYQQEIINWLSKGGVATGYILNKLNQFILDISSIRSKIIRLNPLVSETFSGVFVPLICGINNTTVIGNALDTNVNFISSNYNLLGTTGGLGALSSKYLDTSIIPNTTTEFELNDSSIGVFGLTSDVVLQGDGTINIGGGGGSHRMNNTTSDYVGSSISKSLCTLSRTGSTGYSVYINGLKTNVTRASTTKSNSSLKYGYPSSVMYGNPLSGGYFIGKGLTDSEELILRTAWSSLMTSLIRNL